MTWNTLIAAIKAAGGPTYQYRQIDPVDGTRTAASRAATSARASCSAPTAGWRSSTARAARRPTPTAVADAQRAPQLTFSPGRIDPTNPAFDDSRKPLAGEFTYDGQDRCSWSRNHFNSKGGDDPLFGRFQPPVRGQRGPAAPAGDDRQRLRRATSSRADPRANVVVLGDLNDFEFSETLEILRGPADCWT